MNFDEFLRQACPPLDLEWRKYRRRAARHRVRERLRELGLADYREYLDRLRTDPVEAASLADRMRITVTRFFRERERWERLGGTVLPALLAARPPDQPLRAWSAGCAGGQEPYTLAILWLSAIEPQHPDRSLSILATDIDPPSLQRARAALYQGSELREIPETLRDRWFDHRDDRWSPVLAVTQMVEFAVHNLLQDPPPGTFDLICCRYLPFTYFRRERRLEAARRLHRALAPGGVLMLGAKEELGGADGLFEPWPEAPGIFKRLHLYSPPD